MMAFEEKREEVPPCTRLNTRFNFFLMATALLLSVLNQIIIHSNSYSNFASSEIEDAPYLPETRMALRLSAKPSLVETPPVSNATIPRHLIFSHQRNVLSSKKPLHLFKNMLNTIEIYAKNWQQTPDDVKVIFLDNGACWNIIRKVEPRLLVPFNTEVFGPYKSDICRTSALYLHGGYYFDCDLQALTALEPGPEIDLVTGDSLNGQFYNAIIITPPKSPILRSTLDSMIDDWYFNKPVMNQTGMKDFDPIRFQSDEYQTALKTHIKAQYGLEKFISDLNIIMGPITLRIGYDKHKESSNVMLLHEFENKKENLYPTLVRNMSGWGCNFMVHHNATKIPYFYSRCVGTWLCSD